MHLIRGYYVQKYTTLYTIVVVVIIIVTFWRKTIVSFQQVKRTFQGLFTRDVFSPCSFLPPLKSLKFSIMPMVTA